MIPGVAHVHRVVLSVGHADRYLTVRVVLLMHLVLKMEAILQRLPIFHRNWRQTFHPIICDLLLVLILIT